jgi:hypothetical protein|eukprot:COSAG01_NODE_504_length_16140_cov_40.890967_4_plen_137_part_00
MDAAELLGSGRSGRVMALRRLGWLAGSRGQVTGERRAVPPQLTGVEAQLMQQQWSGAVAVRAILTDRQAWRRLASVFPALPFEVLTTSDGVAQASMPSTSRPSDTVSPRGAWALASHLRGGGSLPAPRLCHVVARV